MKTFADLKIGTVVNYKDMANNQDYVVLDKVVDKYGNVNINVLNKESNWIDHEAAYTEVVDQNEEKPFDVRWRIVSTPWDIKE